MLNHQILEYDEQGRILTTYDEPDHFNGGTPTKDGKLCIVDRFGEVYINSAGYVNETNACAQLEQGPIPPPRPANPFCGPRGRLRISELPPAYYYCGLPYTEHGRLSGVYPEAPPVTGAYSAAFGAAYD